MEIVRVVTGTLDENCYVLSKEDECLIEQDEIIVREKYKFFSTQFFYK